MRKSSSELLTTILGAVFGAAVGSTIVSAVTDTSNSWAIVIGGVIGVLIVVIAYVQDRERN
jgi:uncharacterized membrane protein YeaQ/YmgE (transglycosylase-associated protein family)